MQNAMKVLGSNLDLGQLKANRVDHFLLCARLLGVGVDKDNWKQAPPTGPLLEQLQQDKLREAQVKCLKECDPAQVWQQHAWLL